MDSPLCLELVRLAVQSEKTGSEHLWMDIFGPSGVPGQPAWMLDVLGRTPRGMDTKVDGVWGAHALNLARAEVEDREFDRLIDHIKEERIPGLCVPAIRDDWLARISELDLKFLIVGSYARLNPESLRYLESMQSLTHLVLEIPIGDDAMEHVGRLKNLRFLSLNGRELTDAGLRHVGELPLQFLSLGSAEITDAVVRDLPLTHLVLSGCGNFQGTGIPPTLTYLALSFCNLQKVPPLPESLRYLLLGRVNMEETDRLESLPELESLLLAHAYPESLDWLADLPKLTRLFLGDIPIRDELASVGALGGLLELGLSDCRVEDEWLSRISGLDGLRSLDLKSSGITGKGLAHLHGMENLTDLNLLNNVSIQDRGIEQLIQMPSIRRLNLAHCSFPYEEEQTMGLTDRAAARLGELSTLRRLNVTGNRIQPKTVKHLRESLPGCLVEGGYMIRTELMEACNEGFGLLESGETGAALDAFHRALQEDAECAPALAGLGKVREKEEDFAGAALAYGKAIAQDPDPEHFMSRAYVRARAGDTEGAIEDYSCALELDPRHHEIHLWRAEALFDKNDHAGAITDYTKMIELCTSGEGDPMAWARWSCHLYLNRGCAKLESGDLAGAVADSTTAIGIDPDAFDAWANRAEAQEKQGKTKEAIRDYRKVLEIQPDHEDATRALVRLGIS